nr:uncharacterized protein LOC109164037 [Ipomoea batatas]
MIEEEFWQQKAHVTAVQEGDNNSRYFHSLAVSFFERMFTTEVGGFDLTRLDCVPQLVTDGDNELLTDVPEEEEVKEVVFQMNATSAVGLDGFSGAFYKACWEIVKGDVVDMGGEGLPSTLPLNRGACHRRRRGVAHSYRCCRCLVERKPMTGRPGPPCCSAIASRKEERRGRNREEERRNAAARVSSSPPSATEKQGKRPSPSPSTRKGGSPVDALVAVAAWELHRRNPRCSCLGLLSPLTHNYRHCRNHGSKLHRRRRRTEKEENILACWDGRSPLPSSGTAVAPTSLKRARKLHLDGVLHYLLLYRERRRE